MGRGFADLGFDPVGVEPVSGGGFTVHPNAWLGEETIKVPFKSGSSGEIIGIPASANSSSIASELMYFIQIISCILRAH